MHIQNNKLFSLSIMLQFSSLHNIYPQHDDRLFDKGETNIFSENLVVARIAAQSLSAVLSEWPPSTEPPMFLRQSILPYLFSFQQSESSERVEALYTNGVYAGVNEAGKYLSVPQFISLLEQDISYIFQQISTITEKTIFSIRNLELWLVRIGCRSTVWQVLRTRWSFSSPAILSVVSALENSKIKMTLISEIINELRAS